MANFYSIPEGAVAVRCQMRPKSSRNLLLLNSLGRSARRAGGPWAASCACRRGVVVTHDAKRQISETGRTSSRAKQTLLIDGDPLPCR